MSLEPPAIPPAVELERDEIILKREIAAMEAALALRQRHADLKAQCEVAGIDPAAPPLRMPDIVALVARKYGIAEAEIMGPSHKRHASQPRQEAMYLMDRQVRLDGARRYSLPQIGAFLGGRDHTTVIAGIRRHKKRLAEASLCDRPIGSLLGVEAKPKHRDRPIEFKGLASQSQPLGAASSTHAGPHNQHFDGGRV